MTLFPYLYASMKTSIFKLCLFATGTTYTRYISMCGITNLHGLTELLLATNSNKFNPGELNEKMGKRISIWYDDIWHWDSPDLAHHPTQPLSLVKRGRTELRSYQAAKTTNWADSLESRCPGTYHGWLVELGEMFCKSIDHFCKIKKTFRYIRFFDLRNHHRSLGRLFKKLPLPSLNLTTHMSEQNSNFKFPDAFCSWNGTLNTCYDREPCAWQQAS